MFLMKRFLSISKLPNISRDAIVSSLEQIIGKDNVLTDADLIAPYNQDWKGVYKTQSRSPHSNVPHSLVVTPRSSEHVVALMKFCHKNKVCIVPQGGNTGLVGASVPFYSDEVIVSFSRMNKIESIDESSGVVTCEAGCILHNLDSHLNQVGLCVPLDLAARGSCQIGGNVSTNAGGIRLLKYGSLRENVLGLNVILANGDEMDLMKTVRKDNTGISLKQLFIGSEGTLGLITNICLLCPPATTAETRKVILLECESFEMMIKVVRYCKTMLSDGLNAFELIDRQTLDIVCEEQKSNDNNSTSFRPPFELKQNFYALVEISATPGDKSGPCERFVENIFDWKLITNGVVAQDEKQCSQIWSLRENATEALRKCGPNYKYDVSLPLSSYYKLVEAMRDKWGGKMKHIVGYGHVGDGNLHINIIDYEYNEKRCEELTNDIYDFVIQSNGSISAEHGIGREKVKYLNRIHSKQSIDKMNQIKKLFDPHNLLNPGKFYSCG